MANFEEPNDETNEIFDRAILSADLTRYIDYKLVVNNKLKVIGKPQKQSDINRYLNNIDLVIYLNEQIFNQLPEEDRKIVAESIVAGIHYDTEKDKLNVSPGDIPEIHSGVVAKYGVDRYFGIQSLIKEIFSQTKDTKEQEGQEN